MRPPLNENNVFVFDEDLSAQLFKRLQGKLGASTKSFLFKNINNSINYQRKFLETVKEKLGGAITDFSNYVRPEHFITANMQWSKRHKRKKKDPHIKVKLIGFLAEEESKENENATGEKPKELQLGFKMAAWFFWFNSSGLIRCMKDEDMPNERILFAQDVITLKNNNQIRRLMKGFIEYLISCNGAVTYDEQQFNEAHFVKYWLEYYGIWDNVSIIKKQYLEQYCKNRTLPNVIVASCDLAHLEVNLDALCKEHGVAKQQVSEDHPIILRADDVMQFDVLFSNINDKVLALGCIRPSAELAQYMVIKQYGESNIKLPRLPGYTFHKSMYNYTGFDLLLSMFSEQYGPVIELDDDVPGEQPVVQQSVIEQKPIVHLGGFNLPIQKSLARVEKKDEGDWISLIFYESSELKQVQQELLNIGMGNGRVSNEPRKITYEQDNQKDVFTMKLSKVEYEAIMGEGAQAEPVIDNNHPQYSNLLRSHFFGESSKSTHDRQKVNTNLTISSNIMV